MAYITTQSGDYLTTEGGSRLVTEQSDSGSNAAAIQQFDFAVDLLRAILWEYDAAENLQGLLNAKDSWYRANQTDFWSGWYADVFNLATADRFGLAVWSIILGLPLYVNSPPYPDAPTFGFEGSGGVNFDNGILGDQNGGSEPLPLATQRIALQLRYFQLTGSGCVPEVNRMLKYVFGGLGTAWLVDNHDMTQVYIFNFPVTWDFQYLFNNFDLLPRPAGVASTWVDNTLAYFGFNDFNDNFDNGILGG